jgi:hypothetical protein
MIASPLRDENGGPSTHLVTALRRQPKERVVGLPEVGRFGFDLLMARCAGFKRFVAYETGFSNVLRYSFRSDGIGVRQAKQRLAVDRLDWDGLFGSLEEISWPTSP